MNLYDLFTFSPHPIIIISRHLKEWVVKDINASFQLFTAYTKEDLIDRSISILSHSAPFSQVLTSLASLKEQQDNTMECEISSRFGRCLYVSLQLIRVYSEDDSLYALILNDITEKKWIEQLILERKVEASLLLSAEGVISSISRYYSPVRFNVSRMEEGSIADFILHREKFKIYRFFNTMRKSKLEAELSFTLTLFGDEFTSRVIAKPFYRTDGQLKGYAIVFLKLDLIDPLEDPSYKLRLLMTEKNISVTHLAQTTDISLTTISKIRNGKIKKPQRLTADLIAGELGVVPGEIWSCFR